MLKILSLNIWHDSGDWKARARRIRGWIERLDPDLIGFQEVLRGAGLDQLTELVQGSGFHTDYVAAVPFWNDPGLSFGNAVASRWPLTAREELRLPDAGDGEKRAALTVHARAPFGSVAFTCTHLHWKFHHGMVRERQVVALAEQVLRLRPEGGFPPVVVGDFNAEPDSDEMRFLTGLRSVGGRSVYFHDAWRAVGANGDGTTWSNRNPHARANLEPERRIDYVLTGYPRRDGSGLLEACRVVCDDEQDGVWPSDHFGVYAELRSEPLPGALGLR